MVEKKGRVRSERRALALGYNPPKSNLIPTLTQVIVSGTADDRNSTKSRIHPDLNIAAIRRNKYIG